MNQQVRRKQKGKIKNYSAMEISRLCGVVNQTAINWIKKGHLEAYRTPGGQYRVTPENLASFMAEREIPLPDELAPFAKKGKTVLIAEENRVVLESLSAGCSLEYPHSKIIKAGRAFDAGRAIGASQVDIVVMNSNFKGFSPEDLTSYENLVIICYADRPVRKEKLRLLENGADLYLGRPFDWGQLSIYME